MGGRIATVIGVFLALFSAAANAFAVDAIIDDKPKSGLKIVATLFPQYDFARQIAKDKANVRLILPPGAESHTFEPTPADIKAITEADIFIYTGEAMEPWAKRLIDAAAVPSGVIVVDASRDITLDPVSQADGHDHSAAHNEAEEEADHDEAEDAHAHDHAEKHDAAKPAAHNHSVDPHIWLDPVMAGIMVDNIGQALADKDPANAPFYLKNTLALGEELDALDKAFAARVAALSRRLLVFGDRFAFHYFFQRYGLQSASPYNFCAAGAEPGLRAVIDTITVVKKEAVKYIYIEAMTTSRMASVISAETGAEILYIDSLHNPPLEKQLAGITYQSAMRDNMTAFLKGLE